ncbi:conserved hypothetical protein [Neospora caninum Liverpool]|uniref:Transmembrane protein n=1 Tax=Neospora caninum (strain Liverpool) TaxID=572307 RepID=F0VBJ7_NEOCL|nr:conserved hypothetical protein [Neospora caninum Liverpool]CBZ50981.1 conserved hypothetical protein [Neospora caninum Liverpool]CEL68284.1 TPA: hypothetical protein BN1204_040550 [Neospora caninum Liverpool]|eukprot:XP_003881014.1 conserved hypothetical protein [Neospora caninum Liverpool]
MAGTTQESLQGLVDSPDGGRSSATSESNLASKSSLFWDVCTTRYSKLFDEEEAKHFQSSATCLMLQWVLNILCNVGNFTLAFIINIHPECLHGQFSWTTVHTSINLVVLSVSLLLGVAGIRQGSSAKLFQSCAGHLLLSTYELLLCVRDLCIICFSMEQDRLYVYFRGGAFQRSLFAGVCATAGVSCFISLLNAYKLRKLMNLLHKALPAGGFAGQA